MKLPMNHPTPFLIYVERVGADDHSPNTDNLWNSRKWANFN